MAETLLADLVATSAAVAATRSRLAKVEALAALLRRLGPAEIRAAVDFLCGRPPQRTGVGWATVANTRASGAAHPSLTVRDLDAALDALEACAGPGANRARAAIVGDLLARATDEEADFVRRLLVGELRQGALAGLVTDAVAKAAGTDAALTRRATMLRGDLAATATLALTGGEAALRGVGLVPGRPVQPMLAATSADVAAGLADAGGDASVEWKLDGARIQVHRSGEDVAVFTRNLNDVTERLAGVVELARRLPADRFVLDGEILGVAADASGELRPELFQHTMGTFATDAAPPKGGGAGPDTGVRLQAWFFDILHLDGEDQIDRPLRERLAVLEQIAGPFRIPGTITDSSAVAATVARDALAAGHEGVMVKAADSRYEAGRRGRAWRKVKPVHTVDLVVLAVEWGSGRRRGWLSNLHLGARDPASATAQPRFVMVGKTFKGLTDELLAWQTSELLARRTHDEGHVVHVRPELVVEIALDGVQISRRYPGEVALRFARVRRYRTDKSPAEADTIDTLRRLLPGAVAPDQEIP